MNTKKTSFKMPLLIKASMAFKGRNMIKMGTSIGLLAPNIPKFPKPKKSDMVSGWERKCSVAKA